MGRIARHAAWLLPFAVALALGCSSPPREGFYYTVREGDNLYRIGRRYAVPPDTIAEVNGIKDVTRIAVGTRLLIPSAIPGAAAQRNATTARKPAKRRSAGDLVFAWPVRGELTSSFGPRRGRNHEGIDLAATHGSNIHASEAGKVIHSGALGDYGKVVIVKHVGHFRSVYAHARKLAVSNGQFVAKGQKIAEVGSTGNARGPHLHFEIRYKQEPRDPVPYLP